MLSGEAANTNLIIFDPTGEPSAINRTQCEHANHYTIDAVQILKEISFKRIWENRAEDQKWTYNPSKNKTVISSQSLQSSPYNSCIYCTSAIHQPDYNVLLIIYENI